MQKTAPAEPSPQECTKHTNFRHLPGTSVHCVYYVSLTSHVGVTKSPGSSDTPSFVTSQELTGYNPFDMHFHKQRQAFSKANAILTVALMYLAT